MKAPAVEAPRRPTDIAIDIGIVENHLEGIEHLLRELGHGPTGRPAGMSDADWELSNRESCAWSVLMDALAHERDRLEALETDVDSLAEAEP